MQGNEMTVHQLQQLASERCDDSCDGMLRDLSAPTLSTTGRINNIQRSLKEHLKMLKKIFAFSRKHGR
jgi:hypothetical protein